MPSPLEHAIRDHLVRYLDGTTSLDAFKDWLVGATWDIERHHDPAAEALTYEIKLLLAEESSGYCTEDAIKTALRPLAESSGVIATSHD